MICSCNLSYLLVLVENGKEAMGETTLGKASTNLSIQDTGNPLVLQVENGKEAMGETTKVCT
jgi:hypothetical protein